MRVSDSRLHSRRRASGQSWTPRSCELRVGAALAGSSALLLLHAPVALGISVSRLRDSGRGVHGTAERRRQRGVAARTALALGVTQSDHARAQLSKQTAL